MFVRPTPPPRLELTARDHHILAAIARHRYLTADHVKLLFFPRSSDRAAQRRLRGLWANHYLDRHIFQWMLSGERDGRTAGRRPLYLLATQGKKLLDQERQASTDDSAGSEAKLHAAPRSQQALVHVEHELVATDLLVSLEAVASTRPLTEIQDVRREHQLWRAASAWRARHRAASGFIVSDASFTVVTEGRPLVYHVEVVRAEAKGGNQHLAKKMRRYATLNKQGYFADMFGQAHPRAIIYLAPSEVRAHNLQKLAASLPYAKRLFWFGHFTQVFRAGVPETDVLTQNILEFPFVDGNGEVQRLADQLGSGDLGSSPSPLVS